MENYSQIQVILRDSYERLVSGKTRFECWDDGQSPILTLPRLRHGLDRHVHDKSVITYLRACHIMAAIQRSDEPALDDMLEKKPRTKSGFSSLTCAAWEPVRVIFML